MNLSQSRILVTGASGYLGSSLCRHLTEAGADVHGLSRRFMCQSDSSGNGVNWWQGDLTEATTARRLMSEVRPDAVYHLAALPDGRRDMDLTLPTFAANAHATVHLLIAAAEVGCERFIYAGSMEEPDPGEKSPAATSPYAASKLVGSVYCSMFNRLYGFQAIPLRVHFVYGPGPQARTKLVPYLIRSLLSGQSPKLSSGQRKLDLVYIDDIIDGFLAVLHAEDCRDGRSCELGSGRLVTIRELADTIADIVNNGIRPEFGALPDRVAEVSPVADTSLAEQFLGWTATTSLAEGLRKTVQWYRDLLDLK